MGGLFTTIVFGLSLPIAVHSQSCFLEPNGSAASHLARLTGNQVIDNAAANEQKLLHLAFKVYPDFFVYNDANAHNAYATPERNGPAKDGTVAFGQYLLLSELRKAGGLANAFAVPAIMAHEFAHIIQFKNGTRVLGKLQELQADYIAGWYMGRRNGSSELEPATVRSLAKTFYSIGDYAFNSPSHHGTPEERTDAVLEGFKNATMPLDTVYNESLRYIGAPTERESSLGTSFSSAALGTAFQNIFRDRDTSFATYRQGVDPEDDHQWIAQVKIPGTKDCRLVYPNRAIRETGDYRCVISQTIDETVMHSDFDKFVQALRDGFANGWKQNESLANGTGIVKEVTLKSGENAIQIVAMRLTSRVGYRIYVYVPFDNY